GIGVNQLVDPATASLLLISSIVLGHTSRNILSPIFAYAVLILISVTFTLTDLKFILTESTKPVCRPKMVNLIKQKGGDVISEDTSFTILAGKPSYILDPFLIRLVIQKDEVRKENLFKMIEQKSFSAFIFIQDPKVNNWWYSIVYGPEMVSKVLTSYQEEERCGDFIVYTPKIE
ncbi:MAG TPA: hypothetical protein VN944_05640, partial [Nitrospiria bacterium]|nr:hypothetical protein [Nitrospiria bacterium]